MTENHTAWLGDPDLKARTVAEMAAHREADELVKGTYWAGNGNGRGCAVGCLTHDPSGGHGQYPTRWGIPEELAWLEDTIFENLPDPLHKDWPIRFLAAIEPGADLYRVYAGFSARLMLDPERGNVTRCSGFPEAEAAVRQAGELWRRDDVTEAEWRSAESAAESAARSAESAAWSARSSARSAESAARSARSSARSAAAWSAESAAWSAAAWSAAAWSAAWSAHYQWMAGLLVTCLREAPAASVR